MAKLQLPEFSFGVPEVHVHDNVVSDSLLAAVWEYSQTGAKWEFKNRGNDRDPLTSWVSDILNYFKVYDEEETARRWEGFRETLPFMHGIWDAIRSVVPGDRVIRRTFLNGHTFALGDGVHNDGKVHTFLLYANPEWSPLWGGETIFYNETEDDVIAAVLPKPGRLISFDGRVPHAGRASTRFYSGMRVTLAFQTQ